MKFIPPKTKSILSFMASAGICAAFYKPMANFGAFEFTVSLIGEMKDWRYISLGLWGVFALALINAVVQLWRPSKVLNFVTGIAPFVLLLYCVSMFGAGLFKHLAIGAWGILVLAAFLIFAPVHDYSQDDES